ncbi:uncharacterized protein Dwil_GK17574 [Drosophila willistoni]|uniref:MD-2-related lipid-recognition domain-containing protein n=1 Tax=Drosophila willistoni TaxID=7260 RepID=B4MMU1_DROWI|nr:uncharacterized protein LOC6639444 [Drosophila willistoni]EDW73497.1 uncharacterized protein Dwil_GK17574 [Drosophila willistoni]
MKLNIYLAVLMLAIVGEICKTNYYMVEAFRIRYVDCQTYNSSYVEFTRCEMKLVRRGIAAFYMNAKLKQIPVNSAGINLALHKKSNGYQPFLFNQSLDYCYYMRNPRDYPFIHSFHKTFMSISNINHSCPYDHDLKVDRMIYDKNSLKDFPIPIGDYMLQLRVATYKIWRAEVKIYVTKDN